MQTDTLTIKRQAYLEARTAFKRHEAWGWHIIAPIAEGSSEWEKKTIQAGVETYHLLREEWKRAKRRYKKARNMANRRSRTSETSTSETSSTTSPPSEEEVEVVEEVPQPAPQPAPQPVDYHELVRNKWLAENASFYTALHNFRKFNAKDGKATFVVRKDGANYEDMSLKVEEHTVAGLRLWASILQVPYASKLRRAELEKLLQPVLDVLVRGPTPSRWVYL